MFIIDIPRLADYVNNEYRLTLYKQVGDTTVEMTLANIRMTSDLETIIFAETEKKPTTVIHKFNLYKGFEL